MTAADTESSPSHTKGSLLVIFLTVFIDLLGFGMVLPLLPIYGDVFAKQHEFSDLETGLTIGLLMAVFSAMQVIFAPRWGRLSDRIGRRPVLMIGLGGSVVFYTLFGIATVAHSLTWLFISRIGAGIAGATISTAQAYIADSTTRDQRTKGMTIIGVSFGLGFTFGPLLGAAGFFSADEVGLSPWPGYLAAILSCIALGLAVFMLPESLRSGGGQREHEPGKLQAFRIALGVPSVGMLLATLFICSFSFANFESTIALILKSQFEYEPHSVLYVFAYIGFTLVLAQGLLVRRLAGKVSEGILAGSGAIISALGFLLLALASSGDGSWFPWLSESVAAVGISPRYLLFAGLTVEVTGFSMMQPSLNSLLSRRSDPARQGSILGIAQSMGAMARIAGPIFSITLLKVAEPTAPLYVAMLMMLIGLGMVYVAVKSGSDFVDEPESEATGTSEDG